MAHSMKGLGRKSKEIMIPSQQMLLQASSASERLIQLMGIFDYHIEAQKQALLSEIKPSLRDSQSLARTVMSLHTNLDKYTKMLHPPTSLIVGNEEARSNSQAMAYAEQQAVAASFEEEQSDSILEPEATTRSRTTGPIKAVNSNRIDRERPWLRARYTVQNVEKTTSEAIFQDENSENISEPVQSEPLEVLQAGEWDTEDDNFPFKEVQQAPPNTEGWWYKHAT